MTLSKKERNKKLKIVFLVNLDLFAGHSFLSLQRDFYFSIPMQSVGLLQQIKIIFSQKPSESVDFFVAGFKSKCVELLLHA
jgi:hypothetical protein